MRTLFLLKSWKPKYTLPSSKKGIQPQQLLEISSQFSRLEMRREHVHHYSPQKKVLLNMVIWFLFTDLRKWSSFSFFSFPWLNFLNLHRISGNGIKFIYDVIFSGSFNMNIAKSHKNSQCLKCHHSEKEPFSFSFDICCNATKMFLWKNLNSFR